MTRVMREGFTVYELDEDGVNRWSFHVQPGTGLDGKRQPESVIERVAEKTHLAYKNYDRLREALDGMCTEAEFHGWDYSPTGKQLVLNEARALLAELDNLEDRGHE